MWPLRLQILTQILIQLYCMQSIGANFDPRQNELEHIKESSQFNYLNQKRPLWVLDDEVQSTEREIDHITFTTTERPSYQKKYYVKYRRNKMLSDGLGFYTRKSVKPKATKSIQRLYLPKNYLYARNDDYKRYNYKYTKPRLWRRQQQQQVSIPITEDEFMPSMPIFDSVPTDIDTTNENDEEMIAPIFVYNGPKGELIMNTMLSARKYPMQEPVPGQILYPPTEPIFRPKPIVQSFRMPGRDEPLNLTLIPFYAHEAIVPRLMFDSYSKVASTAASSLATIETTTATPATATAIVTRSPAVIYAAATAAAAPPLTKSTTSTTTTTSNTNSNSKLLLKQRRHKKAKKYAVYRSADEVHWRPTEPSISSVSTATTSFPMVLASPIQNHRFNLIDDGYYGYDVTTIAPTSTTTTTTKATAIETINPMKNFKLTYKDEDSQFQIVYVDESLEKPINKQVLPTKSAVTRLQRVSPPKPVPLLNSHYSADKEYYAFPVYTLGKLLRPENAEKTSNHASHSAVYRKQKQKSATDSDTWFIMNSLYKGQHSNKSPKKLSSKYVEIGPTYEVQSAEDIAETTIEKAITNNI